MKCLKMSIRPVVWWGMLGLWLWSLSSACFEVPCADDTRCPTDMPRCVRGVCQSSEITTDGGGERDIESVAPLHCVMGTTRPCYPTNGVGCRLGGDGKYTCLTPCSTGSESCVAGTWSGVCQGFVGPSNERCNGQDDDCDGLIDNGFANLGQSCQVGVGECQTDGTIVCNVDGSGTECRARAGQPTPDVCNGKDDDCDGQIDNQPSDPNQPLRRICYSGDATTRNKGLCKDGFQLCKNGTWETTCHDETTPVQEICDGKDNDCDGWIDNTFVNLLGRSCSTGLGECKATGHTVCSTDGLGVQCNAKALAARSEVCNGKDDDCNGKIDDNVPNCVQHCHSWGDCPSHYPHCQDGRCIRLCKVDADCDPTYVCDQGRCQVCPDGGNRHVAEECGDGKDNNCNGRIDEQCVTTVAGSANHPHHRDGPGKRALFHYPIGIAMDTKGNLYVADCWNHAIRKIDRTGYVTTLIGPDQVYCPHRIAVDAMGNIYFTSYFMRGSYISKLDPAGKVSIFAGWDAAFQEGPKDKARFWYPAGLAFDAAGNLYVADGGNRRIRKIDKAGNVTTVAGNGQVGWRDGPGNQAMFNQPEGIVVDSKGNIYVTDYSCVRKIDTGGHVTTIAGSKPCPYINPGHLFLGIAVDRSGNVYATEWGYIQKIDTSGNFTRYAGTYQNYNLQPNYKDGPLHVATFRIPIDILIDPAGIMYISDHANYSIRKIIP